MMYSDTLDVNWNRIVHLTNELVIEQFGDREQYAKYQQLLNETKHDREIDSRCTLIGFRRAPASKERHHAFEGGLVVHLLQMWDLWQGLRGVIRDHAMNSHVHLNDSMIWRAILHHDLNKIWKYKIVSEVTWSVDYANSNDPMSQLLGSVHKSIALLNRYGIRLPVVLHNALICAEGGFSETHPRAETVLAKVVYILDEMSANVVDRLNTDQFWDSKKGGVCGEEN